MENYIKKAFNYTNKIYEVIILNFLFLLMNILFFQVYFSINFELKYLMFYFLSSFLLIPALSSIHITRKQIVDGVGESIIKIFFKNILNIVRSNWKLLLVIPILFFISVFNIYIIIPKNYLMVCIFAGNITLLFMIILLAINFIRISTIRKRKKENIEETLTTFIENIIDNMGLLLINMIIFLTAFRISFVSIIFVFGLLPIINNYIFENEIGYKKLFKKIRGDYNGFEISNK